MTQEYRLSYCNICNNRSFSINSGVVCGLTSEKPTFEQKCASFSLDKEAQQKAEAAKKAAEESQLEDDTMGLSSFGVKSMSAAGGIAIVISLVWFFAGILYLERIFFYPVILFILGIITLVKGINKKKKGISKRDKKDLLDGDFTA